MGHVDLHPLPLIWVTRGNVGQYWARTSDLLGVNQMRFPLRQLPEVQGRELLKTTRLLRDDTYSRGPWYYLDRRDSNPNRQSQSLLCCLLHHGPVMSGDRSPQKVLGRTQEVYQRRRAPFATRRRMRATKRLYHRFPRGLLSVSYHR